MPQIKKEQPKICTCTLSEKYQCNSSVINAKSRSRERTESLRDLVYGDVDFFSELYVSEYRDDLLMSEQFLINLLQVPVCNNADLEHLLTVQELQVA